MKAIVWESDYTCGIDLVAESLEDAVWLVRWNQNTKKDNVHIGVNARKDRTMSGYCYWQNKKDMRSGLKR